jgi:methylthioxylose transferase
MMSYGLPLIGLVALAVLAAARRWWPLPVAAVAALAVVLAFVPLGFTWWEAYPVLTDRYWQGLAKDRPAAYWTWGDLSALLLSAGPALGAGVALLLPARRLLRDPATRVVALLAGSALLAVLAADASQMSKAEVERIWLPFVPWLLLSCALLPERWRRRGVVLQLALALVVQHLLFTGW